jgi:hypothetical protein
MITHALIRFDVPITINIEDRTSAEDARDLLITAAVQDVLSKEPKIVQCIERPDVLKK